MKKVLTIFAAVVCAAMAVSCNEDQPLVSLPTATLSADEAFVDGKANITVTLSAAAPVDVTATIAYGTAREGKTAIDIAALKFDEKVTLKAGEKVASCTVELVSTENIPDGAEAPIALAAVSTDDLGTLKCEVAIAYITYHARDYNDEDPNNPGNDPNNPGNDPDNPNNPGNDGLTLRTDWTATIIGEPYWYGDYAYFDIDPTVPGIKYFWFETFTQDDLDKYFEGSVKNLLDMYSEDLKEALAEGDTMAELVFSDADEEYYAMYYGAGATTLYILEFDENGNPTYNYGAVDIVLPEIAEEEPEIYDVVAVNGLEDDALVVFDVYAQGEVTSNNLEETIYDVGSLPAWLAYYYNQSWMTTAFTPYFFTNDAEYNTTEFEELELGKYDVVIVGVTEDGDITGQYNISTIEVDGHEYQEIAEVAKAHNAKVAKVLNKTGKTHFARKAAVHSKIGRRKIAVRGNAVSPRIAPEAMSLQADWQVKVVSEVYTDDYGYNVVDIEVTLPGIKYYLIEENTQEDLDYYYGGTVAGLATTKETRYQGYLADNSIDDLMYSASDPMTVMDVYNPGIETTIYVLEFDETCTATGRYGATVVTLPGLNIPEPDVQVLGPITKHEAWTAEYLGRYEYEDNGFLAPAKPKKSLRINVR